MNALPAKKPFIPSTHQATFFTWVKDGTGSAILIAVAGAGKTTSIKRALVYIPERCHVQLFAFNTDAAYSLKNAIKEMAEETGRTFANMRAGTFHSVGYAAVCKKLGKPASAVKADGKKMANIARSVLGEVDHELYAEYACKLVGYAKGEGIGPLTADTEEAWWKLVQHHDLALDSEDAIEATAVNIARGLLRRSNEESRKGFIDFDDMLYLPLLWRLRLWQNDWVFIDEAQDTNPVRRAIAKLALKPGGRLVAVGDPKQAIYGFTGASHDAIEIIEREFDAVRLPLTVCYRCSAAVVAKAKELVDYIEVAPGAAEGSFETTDDHKVLYGLGATDAILCRNTAPLIGTAYELMAKGVACRVLGREIGKGLVNLIKKMKGKGIAGLMEKLEAYRDREVAKFTAKGEEAKAEAICDRIECIETFIASMPELDRTVPALIEKIEALFGDGTASVLTLSTIHKAKGKEYDTVVIIRPDLMPSKWARQDHQREQESNLQYVADTRAKMHLKYLVSTGAK